MAISKGWKLGVATVAVLAAGGGAVAVVAGGSEGGTFADSEPARNGVAATSTMQVWKTPTCGCCADWVDHMKAAGFTVEIHDVSEREMIDVKQRRGVGVHLSSCHTALVDGYTLEGHVPAEDVQRLLAERPPVRGIAVPGMPVGSPGMEFGDRKDAFDVLAFGDDGGTKVFSSHR